MRRILLAFLLFTATGVWAQEALTLAACLQLAYKNNHLLKIADLSRAAAEEKRLESRAQKWPTVNLNAAYARIGKVTSFSIPMGAHGSQTFSFGTPNRINADLRMQMALFTWGRIGNTLALSARGLSLAEQQKRQEELNVTDQVLRAYYVLLLNQQVVRLHEANVQRTEKHFQTVSERYEAGQSSQLEKLRAQVQTRTAISSLTEARDNLRKSLLFLAKSVGAPDSVFTVRGKLEPLPNLPDGVDPVTLALSNRTELQILAVQKEMTENSWRIARSGDKPQLFFVSSFNVQNGFDPMDPERFVDNWNAGVQLSLPLFDGFAARHRAQQSRVESDRINWQTAEVRDLVHLQIRSAQITLQQSQEKLSALQENAALAQEALRVAEVQYDRGVASSLDLIDAGMALSQAEQLYTQALFNQIMAHLDLCKAVADYHIFGDFVKEEE